MEPEVRQGSGLRPTQGDSEVVSEAEERSFAAVDAAGLAFESEQLSKRAGFGVLLVWAVRQKSWVRYSYLAVCEILQLLLQKYFAFELPNQTPSASKAGAERFEHSNFAEVVETSSLPVTGRY